MWGTGLCLSIVVGRCGFAVWDCGTAGFSAGETKVGNAVPKSEVFAFLCCLPFYSPFREESSLTRGPFGAVDFSVQEKETTPLRPKTYIC